MSRKRWPRTLPLTDHGAITSSVFRKKRKERWYLSARTGLTALEQKFAGKYLLLCRPSSFGQSLFVRRKCSCRIVGETPHSTSLRFPFAYLANKRRIAFGKAWKRRNCVAKSAKPLIVIQRVQIPPDQSRADRSVVSLAIHRATGGCRSVGNKEARP